MIQISRINKAGLKAPIAKKGTRVFPWTYRVEEIRGVVQYEVCPAFFFAIPLMIKMFSAKIARRTQGGFNK